MTIMSSENWPISSPVRLLIQKLLCASDEGFKIASCVAPHTRYLNSVQTWRVIRCLLFLFKHLWTVLIEALLRDVKCTQSLMHLVESAAASVRQQSVALFNELWEQKLINNFN